MVVELIHYNLFFLKNNIFLGGKITEFPVIPIEAKDIVDTNGAGDSFVGGKGNILSIFFNIQWNVFHVWPNFIFSKE